MSENRDSFDDLFWRDEILQIAFWFRGEGFGDEVSASQLRRFLTSDAPPLERHLEQMVRDGYLESTEDGQYRLTEMGHREGARRFADAFEGLNKPAHGECSADCVCQRTGNPDDCVNRETKHAHVH